MDNRDLIYNLVVTGIEGGSYSSFLVEGDWEKAWRAIDNPDKEEAFAHITIVDKYPSEEGGDAAGGPAQLTDQRLTEAWARFQSKAPRHFGDAINENEDCITGDVFLQILAFGEIVYG